MKAALEAERTGESVLGIKGKSVLADSLNPVDRIPIDYMHAISEGYLMATSHLVQVRKSPRVFLLFRKTCS